ncbi:MAG TPA: PDDEXK nuclease domain-containing protein [bacterium]|mgnify:CR=1 FL=1|nr:PDDEXK nuclease domain-containing protein [bacterium]
MKKFFLTYPRYFPGNRLNTTGYRRLLDRLDDPAERRYYERRAMKERWDVSTLENRIRAKDYDRFAEQQRLAEDPGEVFREEYSFEFAAPADGETSIPGAELADRLASRVENFLLEMGRGFTFVERHRRLVVGGEIYPVDLVLFHRGLRCLVLVKIKNGHFHPDDVGRLNLAVNYVRETDRFGDERAPVGLLLCRDHDRATARYALGGLESRLFVARYRMTLPDEREIERATAESAVAV